MNRSLLINVSVGLASAAVAAGITIAVSPANAAPAVPAVRQLPTPVCEGTGSTSFCHITINQKTGEEYLFDEDGHGTIVFLKQTPPK